MIIIEPSYSIKCIYPPFPLQLLEQAGRICYKSEDKITESSAEPFVKRILDSQHESVIEHANMTVLFIVDRGVSHELVRHRLCSFSQESTRYCNYSKYKFGKEITVIRPCFWKEYYAEYIQWCNACYNAEHYYFKLIELGAKPQEARSVLPNSLKTEIMVTANLREWRHIFKLRCSEKAHPQMRQVMIPLLKEVKTLIPVIFEDL